tara:strand:- start:548 stop:676 length:129 start_codon:yes stop_codon:yes gene_type:complete
MSYGIILIRSRITLHRGADRSEVELFWGGFGIILLKFCILFF